MSSSADGAPPPGGPTPPPLGLVVLISGRGSNLQAIIDAIARGELPAVIRAVISNRPDAAGLERARRAGIPAEVVDDAGHSGRRAYEAALVPAIERHRPDLVVLAGFMRILSRDFVRRYDGRMLNIHPSLLPALAGLDTHRRALEAGAREHGASVHFVTEDVDGGPVVVQARLAIGGADTPESLAERVLGLEHRLYPLALRWFAEGRVRKRDDVVLFDGQPLRRPLEYRE
jgi:phosphoribosylglycinamide formyltransferase-1